MSKHSDRRPQRTTKRYGLGTDATRSQYPLLRWAGAITFGYGCTVYVGVDVGAGDVEVDVMYISFIVSVQYIRYLAPYRQGTKTSGQQLNHPVQY